MKRGHVAYRTTEPLSWSLVGLILFTDHVSREGKATIGSTSIRLSVPFVFTPGKRFEAVFVDSVGSRMHYSWERRRQRPTRLRSPNTALLGGSKDRDLLNRLTFELEFVCVYES